MKVEYEALLTKHELIVNEQEKQLKKTHSALQETEHICDERVKIIDQLETTNAELVRIAILSSTKLFFTIIIFFDAGVPQKSTTIQTRGSRW